RSADELRGRCDALVGRLRGAGLEAELIATRSVVGGGTTPGASVPSFGVALRRPGMSEDALDAALRGLDPPVIGRITERRVVEAMKGAAVGPERATRSIIVGTAGHIDHGKTALVHALTGTDTDRLPEEKRRGITIDLGFASMRLPDGRGEELRLSFIDVPGHHAFVRNMLAGTGGIDCALLVIAADEGVKAQTGEHLAICSLLGIERG